MEQSLTCTSRLRLNPKKQNDKRDKKKVKFATQSAGVGPCDNDKQVNVVQAMEDMSNNESENKGSETTLPDETLVSLEHSN